MSRVPSGFHVEPKVSADTYGLSPEEVKEERRARGQTRSARWDRPAVKNPFDEILKSVGLWDRVKETCNAVGVAPCELDSDSKSKRIIVARKRVYEMLKALGWSNVDVGRLFGKDPTTILHALK